MKAREIAEFVGAELHGDGEVEINSVAEISKAERGQISFLEKADSIPATTASCLIVPENSEAETRAAGSISLIVAKNPKLAFAKIAAKLHSCDWRSGWNETSHIHPNSDVRASFIGAFVTVGEGSHVGESSQIHDGSKIGRHVEIGKCSIIYSNCV
ncbi:MAG: LpxD N-terminal domain-containing protein, partial [Blastocatellia bacterium]